MSAPASPGEEGGASSSTLYIISDVHLGSVQCRLDLLHRFLDWLPDDATLVLNGDTIDDPTKPLNPENAAAYAHLEATARRLPVYWLPGNHDIRFALPPDSAMRLQADFVVPGNRLVAVHGDAFHNRGLLHNVFVVVFNQLHRTRIYFGAESLHISHYAKRYRLLYAMLCRRVRGRALMHARQRSMLAITCGHVHFPEDGEHRGCRYLNTGSWLEPATACVVVGPERIHLERVEDLIARPPTAPSA